MSARGRSVRRFGVIAIGLGLALYLVWPRLPLMGDISGRYLVRGLEVDDPVLGRSRAVPTVQELVVADDGWSPGGVGRLVKNRFFPDTGPFVFNVAFSCAEPEVFGPGPFADPISPWFNVFFGYYQVDAAKADWDRPFGYAWSEGGGVSPYLDEVLRLGQADWNYFSNYVYGVPLDAITPLDTLEESTRSLDHGRVKVGERWWDFVEFQGVRVVSGYVSGQDGRSLSNPDRIASPAWRASFGLSTPRPDHPESFLATRVNVKIYMSYREVDDDRDVGGSAYQTLIFGAVNNADHPDRPLSERLQALQMDSIHARIAEDYADLGFDASRTPSAPHADVPAFEESGE